MKIICKVLFGSHLYGTATPTSDLDWKGIFVPATRDVLLGRIPKTADKTHSPKGEKIEPGEEDGQFISLHHFLKLACDGQTMALDMLFAPDSAIIEKGEYYWIWESLRENRSRFLSKRMNAFQGYARAQAAKYSLKGERLNKLNTFCSMLGECRDSRDPISTLWYKLPRDDERINPQGIRELQIGGKWFGESTAVQTVFDSVQKAITRYGKRAESAADDGGVDWKALSHAVRVSSELYELIANKTITFPLSYARILLEIKQGNLPLATVSHMIDQQLEDNEGFMANSDLPDYVDRAWWDDWLVDILSREISNA